MTSKLGCAFSLQLSARRSSASMVWAAAINTLTMRKDAKLVALFREAFRAAANKFLGAIVLASSFRQAQPTVATSSIHRCLCQMSLHPATRDHVRFDLLQGETTMRSRAAFTSPRETRRSPDRCHWTESTRRAARLYRDNHSSRARRTARWCRPCRPRRCT